MCVAPNLDTMLSCGHPNTRSGRGLIGTQRKLFCVTMAMYLATFAYWIALSVSQFQAFYTFRHILSNIYSLIPPADCFTVPSWEYSRSGLPGYCTAIPVPFNPSKGWPSASECVGTVALTFNVRPLHWHLVYHRTRILIFRDNNRLPSEMPLCGGGYGCYGTRAALSLCLVVSSCWRP